MKLSGKPIGIPLGVALGLLANLFVAAAGSAISAWLIASERIGEGGITYYAMFITSLAAGVGALVSTGMIKRLRLQICMISGACFFLTLLAMTALFFGGQYHGLGLSAAVIFGICALVAFLPSKNSGPKAKKKRGYR